jgi:ATP-dependent protease ClpP protease subunit
MNMNRKLLVLLNLMMFISTAGYAADATVRKITLTKDNTLILDKPIFEETVGPLMRDAKALDSYTNSSEPIYLVLRTPGGSIDAGLENNELLANLKRPVKTLSIFAASMGFQTVQALGERLVLQNGTLMSHKARGGFSGEFPGQLDSRYQYYLKRVTRMDAQAVKRSGGKLTLSTYHSLIENEYWCDGQDCVDQGFADAVVVAECDKSLEGSRMDSDKFIMMGHIVQVDFEFSKCPLNTGLLGVHVSVDGQPLFMEPKAATPAAKTTMGPPSLDDIRMTMLMQSLSSSSGVNLDRETLFEINNKVKEHVDQRTNMNVIKGY